MVSITRQQAICMFYCEKYNEENIVKLSKRIEEIEDVDICYMNDPASPLLQCQKRINQNPFMYNLYPTEDSNDEKSASLEIKLQNQVQVAQFLNLTYLSCDPGNEEMFDRKDVTVNEVMDTAMKFSAFFDNYTINAFGQWCGRKKLDFLQVQSKRGGKDGERITTRSLYVLKDKFIHDAVYKITSYLPRYQNYVKSLKKEGYVIIGYARKSPSVDCKFTQKRCLQSMCDRLKERSLVDSIFVSNYCKAAEPLADRDMKKNEDILAQLNVAGDMQDALQFIAEKSKICLVALDYAGLTTNTADLKQFLRNNEQIKKIIVDRLPISNEAHVYESSELIEEQEILKLFDCRKRSYQRSLE
ncbi:hypothetical protein DM01DRAFT_1337010 [Hesseltinella vesiculosa]|uniref:Uncharacterized protein n=1 Tax=Hesseltinella vesiculosa TaxID=101127 RepID=A0A1X2GEQ2_9FUNG|nr:hypothetical protein DM01DRAFT_1337010 [Hesseltinella vesiculosa]